VRGKWLVVVVVAMGVVMAVVAERMRKERGPTLPLQPGTVLLLTVGDGAAPLGPFAAEAVAFPEVHGVSSELSASLAAIVTGRMPRVSGVVRDGDKVAGGVATLAEKLAALRFTTALFTSSRVAFRASGLARGAALVFENPSPDAAAVAQQALRWLAAQDEKPALAWLHLDAWPEGAAALLEPFAKTPAGGRAVIVAVDLVDRARPKIALRVPGGLLTAGRDAHAVSLLDVAPTLLELYGVPIPGDWMEPFLLAPKSRAARFFAFAQPLPAPDLDGDAVTLDAGAYRWRCDPRATPRESVERMRPPRAGDPPLAVADDDTRLRDELRRIAESAFGWRIGEDGVARWPQPR
jgi:hypothetical protein